MANWFCADLETTTDENDCRVWAWSSVNIFDPDNSFKWGTTLEELLEHMFSYEKSIWYFRNLKFDGEFLLNYLFRNGYTYHSERKLLPNTFNTLISDKGQFYCIRISNGINTIEIRDSLKIVTLSIEETAKAFGLEISKLKIDYHKYRPPGYQLIPDEVEYIKNDVTIDAKSLIYFFNQGLTKMTKGSDALYYFQHFVMGSKKNFRRKFPQISPDIDEYLRKAYKGGFVYVNPLYEDKEVDAGSVLDCNSLFPHQMRNKKMPYGEPKYFTGKYKSNKLYDLYVSHIKCMFKIKPGKIPTIQIKHTLAFQENLYLESSDYEVVDLYLTSWDLELFFSHYDVDPKTLEYIDGYMFRSMVCKEFIQYIDYWGGIKVQAGKDGNKGLRTLAKFMLNCLYGKFGLSVHVASKIPYFEDDIVKYKLTEKEEREGVYLPVALFVTAGGRVDTITNAQKIRDNTIKDFGVDLYYYSDTDSIHSGVTDEKYLAQFLEIDDNEIGKWALESHFEKAKFIRQKCYLETIDGELSPTVAGLPKQMHDMVSYDNFHKGQTYKRTEAECDTDKGQGTKKRFKHVPGGVVLVDTHFTIKA